MKCNVCGKEIKGGSFCPRCYAYVKEASANVEGKAVLGREELSFEERSSWKSFYSLQKLKLALCISFILLTSLLYAIVIFHVRSRSLYIASMEETLILATPAPFVLSGILGLISVIKSLVFSKRVKNEPFVIFHKESGANVLFALKDGKLFRCILSDDYEFKKSKGVSALYVNGSTPCVLDQESINATLDGDKRI